mmetsp:Transcript_49539/g.82474  ORF Transcript_49539/g.82474 Transcript_49539/m.82474 type:complete len:205 (-) Transcript_49539:140-754(-)
MGGYRYVTELWKKKQADAMRFIHRIRAWNYRQLPRVHRAPRPTRPDKARMLGYKAMPGFVVYRVRIRRGGRRRPERKGVIWGKPANHGINQIKNRKNLQSIAEERVGRICTNLRVLNSYWVTEDGSNKWYEVILADPRHKRIQSDPQINWIVRAKHKRREARGLTSSGRKHRGLRTKGHLGHNLRPSRRQNWKRRNKTQLWRYR